MARRLTAWSKIVSPVHMKRVLSLDGGGTWALVQARALADIFGESTPGPYILGCFDLVVANSGGSIVAAALACGKTPGEVAALFADATQRRAIFAALPWAPLRGDGVLPKYSTVAKRAALEKMLATADPRATSAPLSCWRDDHGGPDLLILAFDYDVNRAAFFRSNVASRAASQDGAAPVQATLLDAVHASTNAPVLYFDAPAQVGQGEASRRYWDGAIAGYNNPVLAGVIEALANGEPASTIEVVSIGTGTVRRPRRTGGEDGDAYAGGGRPGLLGDIRKLATAILDDPPDAASFTSHVVLGGHLPRAAGDVVQDGPVIRLSPSIQPRRSTDGWSWPAGAALRDGDLQALANLDMDAVSDEDVDLIERLCRDWIAGAVPNQPIRTNDDLAAEIGHDRYEAGRDLVRARLSFRERADPPGA